MSHLANTLTLKVMAEVVRRCSESHGYSPMAEKQVNIQGESPVVGSGALKGHPRQAKLLSDIASGKRRLGDAHEENFQTPSYERPKPVKTNTATTGPLSLNDWLNAQQKGR